MRFEHLVPDFHPPSLVFIAFVKESRDLVVH
jgi:hypothetical protein